MGPLLHTVDSVLDDDWLADVLWSHTNFHVSVQRLRYGMEQTNVLLLPDSLLSLYRIGVSVVTGSTDFGMLH